MPPNVRGGRRPSGAVGPVVGIDLAGVPHRTTGFCLLVGRRAETVALGPTAEILARTVAARPEVVAIDAPLSLPRGRARLGDRGAPHFWEADLELRRRKIPFFPLTLGPMRKLTARGIRIAERLRAQGLTVVEAYPGGAQDLLGLPRKQAGIRRLAAALRRQGLVGSFSRRGVTHDELDAVTAALVGQMLLEGTAELIGDPREGTIAMPRVDRRAQMVPPA